MNPLIIVGIAAFLGVAALVAGILLLVGGKSEEKLHERLEMFTGTGSVREGKDKGAGVLVDDFREDESVWNRMFGGLDDLQAYIRQAEINMPVGQFMAFSAAMGLGGAILGFVLKVYAILIPVMGLATGSLPFIWVWWKRRKRLKAFAVQLPDALDMLARSLRAGQSLAAGFQAVSNEIPAPLGVEFGRVFEEQNLGVPLEQSLRDLASRIPNLDLKFFATAVILQRQTGGDLAEILDKIGSLIRERFQIWGQIQALTGEGRLSGLVLMGLPVFLFVVMFQMNREYVMMLFTDPLGRKMLAVAIIMQIIGALVIRKIVNIKV
ncbi:MAG: secretion protein [Planctomycetota bacterium]|nr:MAG: secretion protein [Planctomycetota bacterium]